MGGKIWLYSEKGKGSSFYFTVPCREKTAPENEEKAAGANNSMDKILKNLTVLIAEDDEVATLYLAELFEEKCKKLLFAENGQEAV